MSATSVTRNVSSETMAARNEPRTPAPSARRKERKDMPSTMGWRIMTLVRALVDLRTLSENSVESTLLKTWVAL